MALAGTATKARSADAAETRRRVTVELGMRRVNWVRIVLGAGSPVCEVAGIANRLPVFRRVPLSTATALASTGVPTFIRRKR